MSSPAIVESEPVESELLESEPAEEALTMTEAEQPEITETAAVEPAAVPVEDVLPGAGPADATPVEAASQVVAFEDAVLQFTFSGDCWLEVRDGNDRLIYADLHQGGDTLGVDGLSPFNILLGDAASAQLVYRGEDFEIPRRPGRTTSRFNVGTR